MKEGLNLGGAKKLWKTRLEKRIFDVEREFEKQTQGAMIPYVKETCPQKYLELAERLVKLQIEKGEYRREDISSSDLNKIKDMCKGTGVSFKEMIGKLVANDAYINYEIVDARHIVKLLQDFDSVYEKFYMKFGAFPLNAIDPDVRIYLKHNKNGMSIIEKYRTVLKVYRPEYANIKIEEYNYKALPRSRHTIADEEIEKIKSELASIAKDGNIDILFSKKYETYFKNLANKLKLAGMSFEEFINEYTDFNYSLCFKADTISAVRQMVLDFSCKHYTTKGITKKDPYLRSKVEAAQNAVGIFTTKELFDYLGIACDNYENKNSTIQRHELMLRQRKLFEKLEEIYPDKIIGNDLTKKYDRIYDELCILAKRFGFFDVNEYLQNFGFSRDLDYKRTEGNVIFLSERDLYNYGFLKGCKTPEEMQKRLDEFGIELVGPYENLGIYRKLAYEKQDSKACVKISDTKQKQG